jgi:ABC-2 type transport system ATP-binding protein
MSMILEVKNLTKKYKNQTAVNDVSFSVQEGEVFGLLGPNGAGKSTTISILTGITKPDNAAIILDGKELRSNLDWVKKRIGYVPQDLALYPTLSAYDNLSFFGQIYGFRGSELKSRIQEVLKIVQLSDRANEIVDHYSGGMKRRVNLAIGLLNRPRILFLDEPTVGVDPQSRNAIFESLEALNREGLTIMYTTHYMEEAERLCNRVAIMDNGKIIALDTPASLIDRLGDGLIQLEFSDENVDKVVDKIRELSSVRQVTQRGKQLGISSKSFEQTIIDALQIASSLNTRVSALNIMEANLETVFLNLTGKSIRD